MHAPRASRASAPSTWAHRTPTTRAHRTPTTRSHPTLAAAAAAVLVLTLLAAVAPATASEAAAPDTAADQDALVQRYQDRVAASGLAQTTSFADVPDAIPGELIVTTAAPGDLQQRAFSGWQSLAATGFVRARPIAERVALVTAEPGRVDAVAEALQADPAVVAVEPNLRREYLAVPDDTSYGAQWAHRQTNAEAAWDTYTGQGGTAPLIAIIDSGVDATHPDLAGVVVSSLRSANGSVFAGTADNDPCGIGHGTAVAGSAAAQGDNGFGVTGVLWQARIIDIALTSPENGCPGGPADADTINAMSYVASLPEPPLAMNLSLGASLPDCSPAYQSVIDQARAAGVAVVSAAGNDGTSQTSIPASCDGVISVGATDSQGNRASYSQHNPQVDIAAPGGDITGPITSCPSFEELVAQFVITTSLHDTADVIGGCPSYSDPNGHRLQGISGTSFAAPYIAGAIGLLRQLAADGGQPLTIDETEAILQATAEDVGQPGRDCDFGVGVVDLAAAVDAVQSGSRPALQPGPPLGSGNCSGGPIVEPDDACPVTQPPVEEGFVRVSAGGPTNAVCQAVAVSAALPSGAAPYAVLARMDDPADALAGSAVGFGVGPLLYTSNTGPLDARTEAELLRVLNFDGRTPDVFIMGGSAAVPTTVDQRLEQLGMNPVRVAGDGREATAVEAAGLVEELKSQVQFETRDYAFVAFGRNWPDAVAAGQMASYYGIPILVTNTDALHDDTRAELQRLQPSRVFVLGGTAVLSDAVVAEIEALGLDAERLAGAGRVDTALAVADAYITELLADAQASGGGQRPLAVAVNMDNNFNDILSASLIGGQGNVYMPLAGDGTIVPDGAVERFCDIGGPLIVVGGSDRIDDDTARRGAQVVTGTAC